MAKLQEVWAKLGEMERLVACGSAIVVAAWIAGLVFGYGAGSGLVNVFVSGLGGICALLALVGAVVGAVALYVRHVPGSRFTWPVPYTDAVLAIALATAAVAVLALVVHAAAGEAPTLVLLAEVVMVVGGGLMAWGGYQHWLASKPAA